MIKIAFLFLLIFSFFGCSANSDTNNSNASDEGKNDIFQIYDESSNSEVLLDERDDYLIGGLKDVDFHTGQIYVIDKSDPKILVLSEQGELLQQVGRSGRGPGEYSGPVSLELYNDDLFLLDQNLGRITRYGYDNGSGELSLKNSGSHDLNMTDLCLSDGDVWIHSSNEEGIIHQIATDLEIISESISGDIDSDDLVMQEISREGILACGDQFLYSGYTADNILRIYDKSEGSLHRQIKFDEITPLEISIIEREGQQALSRSYYSGEAYDDRGDYHDILRSMVLIDDQLLVQYERSFSDVESDEPQFISLSVDLENGTYSSFEELPLIFDYSERKLLSGGDYPMPHIEIHSQSP